MSSQLAVLKFAGLLLSFSGLFFIIWWSIHAPDTAFLSFFRRRIDDYDEDMREQFLAPAGRALVIGQVIVSGLLLTTTLFSGEPRLLLGLVLILAGPTLYLRRRQQQRRRQLEAQLDTFTLSLANALRATPNITRALRAVTDNSSSPLREELQRTLREIQVGSTLDDAVADLGRRIGSGSFDAVMSALLIGRRVGGNVSDILDNTGATLREMTRLHSVLRAKTADGRIQGVVLGTFPIGIVFLFDLLMPGYFVPLTTTIAGGILLACAIAAWVTAIVLARRFLSVQL